VEGAEGESLISDTQEKKKKRKADDLTTRSSGRHQESINLLCSGEATGVVLPLFVMFQWPMAARLMKSMGKIRYDWASGRAAL
jgi:hypothetical protein